MLGWKRNMPQETKAYGFKDRRSFLSRKNNEVHLILKGEDKREQRQRIFDLAEGICANCGKYASPLDCYNAGSWRHIKDGPGEKCDCLHNASWCHVMTCHLALDNPQTKWSKSRA